MKFHNKNFIILIYTRQLKCFLKVVFLIMQVKFLDKLLTVI